MGTNGVDAVMSVVISISKCYPEIKISIYLREVMKQTGKNNDDVCVHS